MDDNDFEGLEIITGIFVSFVPNILTDTGSSVTIEIRDPSGI